MTIAYWCVLVAIVMPYALFGIFNAKIGKGRDINNPRDWKSDLLTPVAKYAHSAHLNTFESNTGFIAAVIIAHLAHAAQNHINLLAALYIVARVLYAYFYLTGKGGLRSAFWGLGLVCTLGLFAISA